MRVKSARRPRLFAAILLLGFFGWAAASEARACSCFEQPVCDAFGSAAAVFVGRVTGGTHKIEYKDEDGANVSLDAGHVSVEVQEVFSGPQMTTTTVYTGKGATSCDSGLLRGVVYLIYAYGEPGKYSTGMCTRTRPVADAEAEEDLKFLRELPLPGVGGRVSGGVFKLPVPLVDEDGQRREPEGLPGIEVTIREVAAKPQADGAKPSSPSSAKSSANSSANSSPPQAQPRARRPRKLFTDAAGRFELTGVRPGKYEISAALPEGYSDGNAQQEIEVGDRGCAQAHFSAVPDGRLKGRIVDAEGRPVPKARVVLVARDRRPAPFEEASVDYVDDAEGRFELGDVPPGEYYLGLNLTMPPDPDTPYPPTYYPGVADRSQATVIRIGLGQKLTGYVLRLPPKLVKRRVRGRVVWPDGSPAAGVSVHLEDRLQPGWAFGGPVETDADGRFELPGFAARAYWVHAGTGYEPPDKFGRAAAHAEPHALAPDADALDLKLVLTSEGGTCEHYRERPEK